MRHTMNGVIGDLLPLAVAVAISPLPIIAAILMLFSTRARANGLGFLLGWTVGILVVTVVFTLLSGLIPPSSGGSQPIVGVIKLLLGVLLVLVAIRQWRGRPREGATAATPKWMSAIDSITPVKAIGLGLLLSAANPKNLMMGISAGVTIGTAKLTVGGVVLAIAIFVVIAILTIAIPVLAYVIAPNAVKPVLQRMRGWLVENNAIVMAVLLVVIGVASIGKGIAAF
jgi:threonine/homoserine/homoserine lactone efflux protein